MVRKREKEAYDEKMGKGFKISAQVLLFNHAVRMGKSKKFAPRYKGPHGIE